MKLFLTFLLSLSPQQSASLAAWVAGVEEGDLLRIAHRESRLVPVAEHERDRWASARIYRKLVNRRSFIFRMCSSAEQGWSSRGSWGLMAGYHDQYLLPCMPPSLFDVPIFSALVAAHKLSKICSGKNSGKWAMRWSRGTKCQKRLTRRQIEDS